MKTLLLGICCCMLIQSCSTNKKKNTQGDKFPVTNPIILDTIFSQEYVADIHAVQNVEIRARIKGFIDKIHVDEGKSVKAGQLLFSISSQEYYQALLRAQAQLKNAIAESKMAEVQVLNTDTLVRNRIVSGSELEMAKARLEAAEAKIQEAKSAISSAELSLSFASIKAPFDGKINRLPLKAGSLVDEGALLTTISNDNEVFAYFNLSEKQYLSISDSKEANQNKTVKLLLANGKVFPFSGNVETAESEIDKSTGNLAFRARFKNSNGILKHGASGKILLTTKLSKAMLIPQKASFEVQENNYVYVINKDNIVESRAIVIGQRLPHLYVIHSGLSPYDQIIYEGIQRIKDGDKVIPEMTPMKSIMKQLAIQ